jgi:hypothetical protein
MFAPLGSLHFQFGFSCGAIVTQEKLVRSVAIIRQLEREGNGVFRGIFTKENEPVGTRREAAGGGRPLSVKTME